MARANKNENKKKEHEEKVFANTIRLAKTKRKMTRDILSLVDGDSISRKKEERPDFVMLVRENQIEKAGTVIGVEHFLVEQVSRDKKSRRVSIIDEKKGYAEKIIDNKDEYLKEPEKEKKARKEITEAIYDIAVHTNKSGISDLKKSFCVAFEKHLSNIDEYRNNLLEIADDRPVKMVFLIEIHSHADDVFLNNGKTVKRRKNGVYPIFTWMVEELGKANPEKLEYIILYMTNSANDEIEDIVAIETKDVQGSLRKQEITIYEFCDDPSQIEFQKNGMTENGFEYSVEMSNKDSYMHDLLPALQQAYEFRQQSIPFVAPRSVQAMMSANGKATFVVGTDGLTLKSEFDQKEVLRRFDQFIEKYPVE